MSDPRTATRQHAIGGAVGVIVLVFALLYRFFPQAIEAAAHVHIGEAPASASSAARLGELDLEPVSAESELSAGPPIALAPSDVIARRARGVALAPAHSGNAALDALLARADAAEASSDPGWAAQALALYRQAAALAPENRDVRAGLDALRLRAEADAVQALAGGDAQAAHNDLDVLRQLPDATSHARTLAVRVAVMDKLKPLLERAALLQQQGRMLGPGSDNALALYRKVLALDSLNVVARQGLLDVQKSALDRALLAAAQGDDVRSEDALADAALVLPASPALDVTRARIEAMRASRGANLLAQAQAALDAGRPDLAQKLALDAQSAADTAEVRALLVRIGEAHAYAGHTPGQVFADRFLDIAGQTPDVVVIPLGTYTMGAPPRERGRSDAEGPLHQVTFARAFALARSEVTVAQFRQFVRATGYITDAQRLGGSSIYDESNGGMQTRAGIDWRSDYAGRPARDDDPVVNVSWNDAQAYAQWLSQRTGKKYRLPSEAEYEYAERAGTVTRYWWGDGAPKTKVENLTGAADRSPAGRRWSNAFAGYGDGYWGPAPVMSFAADAYGLFDMDGNVSEWVADCWHENYNRAPRDGSAWINPGCAQRVIRGGSWASAPDQDRSAFRQAAAADSRSGRTGFRVVREL